MTQAELAALIAYIKRWYPRVDILGTEVRETGMTLIIAPDGTRKVYLWQDFWTPAAFDLSFSFLKAEQPLD